jgi:small neutral amino acid transporter SnatA (MarC family)
MPAFLAQFFFIAMFLFFLQIYKKILKLSIDICGISGDYILSLWGERQISAENNSQLSGY